MIYPWQKLIINREKLKRIKPGGIAKDVIIEPGVHINGPIEIDSGTVLKSGTYIEGPVKIGKNCIIGPNCYIREFTFFENNTQFGASCEIKNSIVSEGSRIKHLSYIADSVIGKNVNIGAGSITANLRHDKKNVKVMWRNKLLNSETKKFGCYIGNYVKLGISTMIYPGVVIADYSATVPGEIVKKNLESFHIDGQKMTVEKIIKFWPHITQEEINKTLKLQ
jgi:bifunctional UDP-N-acetylglucosamine pyrophosphorylase/glucosamine-1-phosphate N-acetyltransferase